MQSALPVEQTIQQIRDNLIGQYQPIETPFGTRPLVYADYTASGRSLRNIEATIVEQVLPYYANTHSEISLCAAQTTALREAAREIIAEALGCDSRDRVIFCGSGATAAINRLVDMLGLRRSANPVGSVAPAKERPVVFIGPYEHHSNELPWRESIADVVRIPADERGQIDVAALERALLDYAERPLRIGSFSAASNVTGVVSDVVGITTLLKARGALAFWDYAAGGPYLPIAMNHPDAPIDALFLSPHKFVGGPGTPGVLALKAALATNPVPAMIGGGTVSWVSPDGHRYLDDVERREEGGTPAIVESIRAGLAVRLKQSVGAAEIHRRESALLARARRELERCESIEILGPGAGERLAILPLRFHHGDRELHYGFVVALLNDLFGIQARGGCSCAGPYGHELLDIDADRSRALESSLGEGCAAMRPGWVRLNLNYFIEEQECDYITAALALVAEHGWRLLPAYELNAARGSWSYRGYQRRLPVSVAMFGDGTAGGAAAKSPPDFEGLLNEGRERLLGGATPEQWREARDQPSLSEADEALRWFTLATDIEEDFNATPYRVHSGATAAVARRSWPGVLRSCDGS